MEQVSSAVNRTFVSLASDFGIHSEGCGIMKGTVLGICPDASVIDLTHGIASFSVLDGARELETVAYLPVGIHVCVVDPGVGTERRALIIATTRGDVLIGPDNGVLLPAARKLGGIQNIVVIEQSQYVNLASSRTFGGRDVFATAAGWLARGVPMSALGPDLPLEMCCPSAFDEATITGGWILAQVIHINKFGSAILNLREEDLDVCGRPEGSIQTVVLPQERCFKVRRGRSFAAVTRGEPVLVPDDYGRMELAINMGSFAAVYCLSLGDGIKLQCSAGCEEQNAL